MKMYFTQINVPQWHWLIWRPTSHLTHTGHPGHSGLAGVSSRFHVPLSKEEIEFVVVPDRAVDALSQKRWANKIRLCGREHHISCCPHHNEPITCCADITVSVRYSKVQCLLIQILWLFRAPLFFSVFAEKKSCHLLPSSSCTAENFTACSKIKLN